MVEVFGRYAMPNRSVINTLARSLIAGASGAEETAARLHTTLGRQARWVKPLARRYAAAVADRPAFRLREARRFLECDPDFHRAIAVPGKRIKLAHWIAPSAVMRPVAAARSWQLPAIVTAGELADWLWLNPEEVEWLADLRRLNERQSSTRLQHYRYEFVQKHEGAPRLIEMPKARLKRAQRQVLAEILNRVPAHEAAHGFIQGRSICTSAAPHLQRRVVLRMDLANFFPSFSGARAQAFFRAAGYPETVADLLGGLCTNCVARKLLRAAAVDVHAQDLYARPHLPQGAPTSPALANIMAYRADCRLSAYAQSAGAVYTRYADDLAFSGGAQFHRSVEQFGLHVAAILLEEGFSVNHRKTRIMRRGTRQSLAGVVVNDRLNRKRDDFDKLKATLTNCVRHGPAAQNRDSHADFRAHLLGQISFLAMLNPQKAQRLRVIFEQIRW